jgi:hypothetical protein
MHLVQIYQIPLTSLQPFLGPQGLPFNVSPCESFPYDRSSVSTPSSLHGGQKKPSILGEALLYLQRDCSSRILQPIAEVGT